MKIGNQEVIVICKQTFMPYSEKEILNYSGKKGDDILAYSTPHINNVSDSNTIAEISSYKLAAHELFEKEDLHSIDGFKTLNEFIITYLFEGAYGINLDDRTPKFYIEALNKKYNGLSLLCHVVVGLELLKIKR